MIFGSRVMNFHFLEQTNIYHIFGTQHMAINDFA